MSVQSVTDEAVVVGSRTYKRTTVERAAEKRRMYDPPWPLLGEALSQTHHRMDAGMPDVPLRITRAEWAMLVRCDQYVRTPRFVLSAWIESDWFGADIMLRPSSSVKRFQYYCGAAYLEEQALRYLVDHDAIEIVPASRDSGAERIFAPSDSAESPALGAGTLAAATSAGEPKVTQRPQGAESTQNSNPAVTE